ncbi:hypothetical protein [Paraburkholderia sp. SIMBA_030]|uniref:hypothetical protein n=1 Tax=Paraburkholderia sp. SIMBA_030 TaxID=3085773 RepID=UPI00397A37C2
MTQQTHDMTDLQRTLIEQLGEQCVSLDAGVLDAHAGDWSDVEKRRPQLVLMPRTPDEAAKALGVLSKLRQKVVVHSWAADKGRHRTTLNAEQRLTRAADRSLARFRPRMLIA